MRSLRWSAVWPALSRWTSGAVLCFLGVKLTSLLVNLRLFPTLRRASPAAVRPAGRVALLVPMRDEAHRLGRTLPGLLAAGGDEVVFLDDGSTDGTTAVVTRSVAEMRAAGTLPVSTAVRTVTGAPRPEGWTGKTWACAQLADLTDADVLVFCDADVVLGPHALAAVLTEMDRQQAAVFSVFPRQLVGSWAERLLTPLITDVVLCFLPFPLLRAPAPSAATANGSVLVFTREAYRALGGFAAVRHELVEDVAVARRTRRLGLRLGLALGGDLVATRMYDGPAEVVVGLGRGLVAVAGGRRWPVPLGLALHLIAYTAPMLLLGSPRWRLAAAMGVVERLLVEAKTGGRDWTAAVLVAAAPPAAVPVVRQALRREQIWKGRRYS
ncbi:MAG: glycosyltransferase [Nakamurella sp.]